MCPGPRQRHQNPCSSEAPGTLLVPSERLMVRQGSRVHRLAYGPVGLGCWACGILSISTLPLRSLAHMYPTVTFCCCPFTLSCEKIQGRRLRCLCLNRSSCATLRCFPFSAWRQWPGHRECHLPLVTGCFAFTDPWEGPVKGELVGLMASAMEVWIRTDFVL